MANNELSIQGLYEYMDKKFETLEARIGKRIDTLEVEVAANTTWRNRITGQFVIAAITITTLLGAVINKILDDIWPIRL